MTRNPDKLWHLYTKEKLLFVNCGIKNLFLNRSILPKTVKQVINFLLYRGYSLWLKEISFNKKVGKCASAVLIQGTVLNNGIHSFATGYIIIRIIDPYNPNHEVFNSNQDLPFEKRRNLIVYDIDKTRARKFAFTWEIPDNLTIHSLYIRVDLWSPRKLYQKRNRFYYPYLFDTSGWKGFIEVINRNGMAAFSVFISYSWVNEQHRQWVLNMADMLIKHGLDVFIDRDVHGGQEITRFMETKIEEADIVLLVCSDVYTKRANDRTAGAGYETVIATKRYYSTVQKEKFIPVTRDNSLPPTHKIPTYLGSALFIDMDTDDWHAEPLQKLLQAINRFKTR